jgi:hypothetical protein
MSTQYRLVQSGKTASGGCSAGQGSSEPVAPRIKLKFILSHNKVLPPTSMSPKCSLSLNEISGSHGGNYEGSLLGYSTLMIEAVCTSETSVYFNQITQRYTPECSYILPLRFSDLNYVVPFLSPDSRVPLNSSTLL